MVLSDVGELRQDLFILPLGVERRKRESYSQDTLPPTSANPEVGSLSHSCCVVNQILQHIMKAEQQTWQGSAVHLHHARHHLLTQRLSIRSISLRSVWNKMVISLPMALTMLRGLQIRFPDGFLNPGFVTPHSHKVTMRVCGVTTVM